MANSRILRIRDVHLAFVVSVALHLCIVLLCVGLLSGPRRLPEIVVADLTLVAGSEDTGKNLPGSGGNGRGKGGEKPGPGIKKTEPRLKRELPTKDPVTSSGSGQTDIAVSVSTRNPPALSDSTGDMATHGEQSSAGKGGEHESGLSPGSGGHGGGYGTNFGQGGGGRGGGSFGGEGLQGGSDYYYIRDTVMRNITYPERARRMGQEGKVVLSFIVLESGATGEVKVVNGSGYRLLDESAKEGVLKTTIHKKVPYRIVVTLPITYKLQ